MSIKASWLDALKETLEEERRRPREDSHEPTSPTMQKVQKVQEVAGGEVVDIGIARATLTNPIGPSEAARKLLKDPPGWLRDQIEHARGQGFPERLLEPMSAAVAKKALGDGTRGAEVLPAVEAFLTHGVGCDCEECA